MQILKLSGQQRQQLRRAILSAYPEFEDLRIFVDENFGENLAAIANTRRYEYTVFDLIQRAEARGWLDDLIVSLYQDTPNNPDIQQFCAPIQDYVRHRLLLAGETEPSPDTRSLFETDFDWEGPKYDAELQAFLPRQLSLEADVGTLRRGILDCANAVCKITSRDNPHQSGTGVLIAPDLVLTNYHVLTHENNADLQPIAASLCFEFGYISTDLTQNQQTQQFSAHSQQPVVAASEIDRLDYALLRLEPSIQNEPIQPVSHAAAVPSPKTGLNLLQHPEGERMKVSLSSNGVVSSNSEKGKVWYVNRTAGGSSGAPCFDEDWQLVALHHAEIARGFGSIREGILFASIRSEIASLL